MYSFLPILASFAILPLAPASPCPFPGPDLLQPRLLSSSSLILSALENLTSILDSAVAGDIDASFLVNQTSFSIAITDARHQLWSYHHTAPTTTNGTHSVGDHSQYRIASITKMITDLLLLRLGLDLEDKITEYLPGLKEGKGGIKWERITLRDLGSHMSGLQPMYGYPEDYSAAQFYQQLGFPPANKEDYPLCEVAGLRPQICSQERKLPSHQVPRSWC
jgi:CubicO group peptidase (beta-lactamase class C family)